MKVLAISAHTDDAVVIAGGTITRLIEEGNSVYYLGLCYADDALPAPYGKGTVRWETQHAAEVLGIDAKNLDLRDDFPNRLFHTKRQELLDLLVKLRNEHDFEMVFCPSTKDVHQDHRVVCQESIRAFKNTCSILGFDYPWSSVKESDITLFFELTPQQLHRKLIAIKYYQSQQVRNRSPVCAEFIRSMAVERGTRILARYAEGFEVIREIRRCEKRSLI